MKHFKESEFVNYGKMDRNLLNILDKARDKMGVPFHILSSYREGKPDVHTVGRAVDFWIDSKNTFPVITSILLNILIGIGYPFRLGIYTWGSHGGFWHLDNLDVLTEKTPDGKTPSKYWLSVKEGDYRWISDKAELIAKTVIECGLSDV